MTISSGHKMSGLPLLLPRMTEAMWQTDAAKGVITFFRRSKREDELLGVELPEHLEAIFGSE